MRNSEQANRDRKLSAGIAMDEKKSLCCGELLLDEPAIR
jgi:hypothetical protein